MRVRAREKGEATTPPARRDRAKRAKRGADERPPAPVEPRPGVGGSIGGDGEAAAVGMDGTSGARDTSAGRRELLARWMGDPMDVEPAAVELKS